MALETAKELFSHYPGVITEHLGLQKCQDTVVGDAMLRGVFGGERKRVTLGEMEFGMKYVAFMDEVSTGLDSAMTFDIINTQRSIAKTLHKTIVIALLQPTPEVFMLFDDVMLLNDGEVLYYGPTQQAIKYFSNRGLECPPGRDVADFFLGYWHRATGSIRCGKVGRTPNWCRLGGTVPQLQRTQRHLG